MQNLHRIRERLVRSRTGLCNQISGLVPRQESSGGKTVLRGITKRGDKYLRKLLVHGARSELRYAEKIKNTWALMLKDKNGINKTAVAMANKSARRIWSVLAEKEPIKMRAA